MEKFVQDENRLIPREEHVFAKSLPEYVRFVSGSGKCKSCGYPVIWVVTQNQKKMPLNLGINNKQGLMTSHFATCKHAKAHRKKRPKKEKR